jgi:hypothetical protein
LGGHQTALILQIYQKFGECQQGSTRYYPPQRVFFKKIQVI